MRTIIILAILISTAAYAADEIQSFYVAGETLYATIRNLSGQAWDVAGNTFEAWNTMSDYALSLTDKSGGLYVGDFDTDLTSAGYYYLITCHQIGVSPADTDPPIWTEYGYWDGDEWFKGATFQDVNDVGETLPTAAENADAVWDEAMAGHTGETTFGGELQTLDPNITLILADTNELQTDWTNDGRLDVILDAVKYATDLISLCDTTVKGPNDTNNFTIEDGTDVNDAYWFMAIQVEDADGNSSKEIRWIDQYDENSGDPNVWVDEPFSFTPAAGDVVHIMGTTYGGYLDLIYDNVRQGRSVVNIIDGTGSGVSRPQSEIIWRDEDGERMPGL